VLYIELLDTIPLSKPPQNNILFKCRIKKENGIIGYSAMESYYSIPSELFKCIKPVTDQMLRSYWNGMTLSKEDFCWITTDGDNSFLNINRLDDEVLNHLAQLVKEKK